MLTQTALKRSIPLKWQMLKRNLECILNANLWATWEKRQQKSVIRLLQSSSGTLKTRENLFSRRTALAFHYRPQGWYRRRSCRFKFDPLRHHSKRNTKENLQNKTRMVEFGTLARETASSHFRWLTSAMNACLASTIICTDTSPKASYKYVTKQIEKRFTETIQSRYNYRLKNFWLE